MKKYQIYIISAFSGISLIVLFWIQRDNQVEYIIKANNDKIVEIVQDTIKKQFRLDGGTPFILYPQRDSVLSKDEQKRLQDHLKKIIINTYINPNDSILMAKDFVPFIIYPNKKNKLGNYTLTTEQLEGINKHIQFLTNKIDLAVSDTKEEVNRDIDRLNLWVSVWIGAMALLGLFTPLYVNYHSTKDIDNLKNKIGGLDDIREKADQAITKANSAETQASDATKKAITSENMIDIIYAFNGLRTLDINSISFIRNKKQYLKNQLVKITTQFNKDGTIEESILNNSTFIGGLKEFFVSINAFKTIFSERNVTDKIVNVLTFLDNLFKSDKINQDNLKELGVILQELITSLNSTE